MLPDWPDGTVAILTTSGEWPHAIPVSTAVRAGPDCVLIALAAGRGSLARLLANPRVALAILSADDVAVTAYGTAHVVDEKLADGVVAVKIVVSQVKSHHRPTFVIDAGVSWRWIDAAARERDRQVRAALARLATHS